SCMPLSPEELSNDCLNADRSPEIADRSVSVNFAMSGWASQVPLSAVSAGPKAAGLTRSGPYVVYPLMVLDPPAPIGPIDQYEAAEPDSLRGANRPVSRKLTPVWLIPSLSLSTSPGETCSNAAAAAGRAAGTGSAASDPVVPAAGRAADAELAGAPGHWPATRTAWLLIPPSAAATSSGVFPLPALAGRTG